MIRMKSTLMLPKLGEPVRICITTRQNPRHWAVLGKTYDMFKHAGFYANRATLDCKIGALRTIDADYVTEVDS